MFIDTSDLSISSVAYGTIAGFLLVMFFKKAKDNEPASPAPEASGSAAKSEPKR